MAVTVPGNATSSGAPIQYRLGRQVPEYYVSAVRAVETASKATRDALTGGTVAAWVTATRAALLACMQTEPTPVALNAVTTSTLTRTGYKIHKVHFDSDTGWRVTGNLYVPTAAETVPAPAVLVLCGHDARGKYGYREIPQSLAKLGYVALIIDALGMGERKQFASTPVSEHVAVARQSNLLDRPMAGIQRWDAKVALDYLAARSEVNAAQLGVCGHSGGGTQAAWLAATDSRIMMAAVSGFITRNSRNLESEMIGDPDQEQYPPRMLSSGLVLDDVVMCCAPMPYLIAANELDYFDVRGAEAVNTDRAAIYTLLGGVAADRPYYAGTTYHAIYKAIREQFYALFKHATGGTHSTTEPAIDAETEADLNVTPTGNVNDLVGAKTSQVYLTDISTALATARGTPTGAALITAVETVLRLPSISRATPPDFRIWETALTLDKYPTPRACVYGVETEPGIFAAATMLSTPGRLPSRPPTVAGGTRCILYVSHVSADQELSSDTPREPLITTLMTAEPGVAFVAMDVRDVGQGKPSGNSSSPSQLFAGHAEMLDAPMLGRRVWDVLRVIDMLADYGYTDIHLAGTGNGSVVAALAGLLESNVTQVSLRHTLSSWTAIATAAPNAYAWPEALLPSGVLVEFDYPDVLADLTAGKALTSTEPWGIYQT